MQRALVAQLVNSEKCVYETLYKQMSHFVLAAASKYSIVIRVAQTGNQTLDLVMCILCRLNYESLCS